jgi:hypothetical protein
VQALAVSSKVQQNRYRYEEESNIFIGTFPGPPFDSLFPSNPMGATRCSCSSPPHTHSQPFHLAESEPAPTDT